MSKEKADHAAFVLLLDTNHKDELKKCADERDKLQKQVDDLFAKYILIQ